MSITAAQIVAKVVIDNKDADEKLKKTGDEVKNTGSGFQNVLSTIGGFVGGAAIIGGVTAAVGFLAGQVAGVVAATNEADQTQAQLSSTLKSTGDASGETMKGLEGIADGLSSVTTYSKPAVEQSEKVLLTFTSIHKDVFPAATKATADLAARMGIDLNSAALLVGKALNDPVKGMAALHREGVDLSAVQQEQVKHFMKVGDVADAQKVILGELSKEMGGAAQAAGSMLGGQLDIAKNKFADMEATIGDKVEPIIAKLLARLQPLISSISSGVVGAIQTVLPIIVSLANHVLDFVTFLQTHEQAMTAFKIALAAVGVVIAVALVAAFISWATAAGAAAVATIAATWPVLLIIAAIAAVIAIIVLAVTHWKQITDVLGKFKDGVARGVGEAFSGLGTIVHNVWGGIQSVIKGAINVVISDIDNFINLLNRVQIHVPSVGIGPVHTPAFDWNGLNIPDIPLMAEGGSILSGGLAVVGERGPELVSLPGGSQVFSNAQSRHAFNQSHAGSGSSADTPVIFQFDSVTLRALARGLMPYIVEQTRIAAGIRNI